jgi:hypothetical protein
MVEQKTTMKEEAVEEKTAEEEINPYNNLKYVVYFVIVLGFILFKFNIVNSPCDTCSTIFKTKTYELKSGISLFGTKYQFCDDCAEIKKKEIEKENKIKRYRYPYTY